MEASLSNNCVQPDKATGEWKCGVCRHPLQWDSDTAQGPEWANAFCPNPECRQYMLVFSGRLEIAYAEYIAKQPKTWQDRLLAEAAELESRLEKLGGFLCTPDYHKLAPYDGALLRNQQRHMQAYLDVLRIRIARFSK